VPLVFRRSPAIAGCLDRAGHPVPADCRRASMCGIIAQTGDNFEIICRGAIVQIDRASRVARNFEIS
jgi:hypothetical protein